MADADALRREASEHLGATAELTGLEQLQGGASRELWGFSVSVGGDRRKLVLRADPEGERDPAAREREFALLRAAHDAGVPVPEPLWLRADGSGIVMQRVDGEAIARRLLRDDRYARARERLVGQVAAAAAAIHRVEFAGLELDAPDAPPAEAAIAALEAQLDALGEPHPALELGLRWLRRHLPDPVAPALVHGDFRLGNWLVTEDGLAAVLDWELCHAGDPVEDLAWLCIRSWRFGSNESAAAGMGSRDELLAAYAAAGGRAVSRDELRFWEVMGNVRWGVICVMQADRHLSGSRRSLEHAAIGRRTCEPEWDLLAMVRET